MDYYSKYIKYKNKYLEHKKMLGGAFAFDHNTAKLAIIIKIGGPTLERINARRMFLGIRPLDNLHITLLELQINTVHPDFNKIFRNENFYLNISKLFKLYILDPETILNSPMGQYEFLGYGDKFWTRVYRPSDTKPFKNFRLAFYELLSRLTDPLRPSEQEKTTTIKGMMDTETFMVYNNSGGDLYAVSKDKYYGITTWKPHVSILRISELDSSIQNGIKTISTDEDKTQYLLNEIRKSAGTSRVEPISEIILNNNIDPRIRNDFKILTFSLNKNPNSREEYNYDIIVMSS